MNMDLIKTLMPLIVLNYTLAAWCLWMIIKKGVRNLNRVIWSLIVLFVTGFGSVLFLIIGRKNIYD